MRIKKLSKIKNIGSFQLFEWDAINPVQAPNRDGDLVPNETRYKKYNLSYGENGIGKSTIVKIFKALHEDSTDDLKKTGIETKKIVKLRLKPIRVRLNSWRVTPL